MPGTIARKPTLRISAIARCFIMRLEFAFRDCLRADDHAVDRQDIPTRCGASSTSARIWGFIPSFTDWVKAIRPEPWMGRTEKIEALVDPQRTPPVVEVR